MEKLTNLRNELSVPKNQYNSFGKYNYRNQEDILEAVKPLLKKHGLLLTITDELFESESGRHYIKSTVSISEGDKSIISTGFAREPEVQKGMNESQITGSASSYARKYALNAMFLIDDTKDADTDEHHKQTNQPTKKTSTFARQVEIDSISALVKTKTLTDSDKAQIKTDIKNAKTKEDFDIIYANIEGM